MTNTYTIGAFIPKDEWEGCYNRVHHRPFNREVNISSKRYPKLVNLTRSLKTITPHWSGWFHNHRLELRSMSGNIELVRQDGSFYYGQFKSFTNQPLKTALANEHDIDDVFQELIELLAYLDSVSADKTTFQGIELRVI